MTRVRVFVLVVVGCVLVAGGAIAAAVIGDRPEAASAGIRDALREAREGGRPVVLYRSLAASSKDQLAIAPADGGAPRISGLRCDRLHFDGGSGLCVTRGGSFAAGYRARIFGPDLRVRHEVALPGLVSRARVSPDGRWGSVTMFVTGHSYAADGAFSTETTLIDLRSGRKVAALEDFTTSRDGRVVTAVDVNYWGVTFVEGTDRFYATLATGGRTYLVEGSIGRRTMRTLATNVECPSLSPDGTRIAFKKRIGDGEVPWRLTVLDLATLEQTPLAETAGIDDQAEWLDDGRVLYGLGGEVRVVNADGSGAPRRYRAAADSPAVVRW